MRDVRRLRSIFLVCIAYEYNQSHGFVTEKSTQKALQDFTSGKNRNQLTVSFYTTTCPRTVRLRLSWSQTNVLYTRSYYFFILGLLLWHLSSNKLLFLFPQYFQNSNFSLRLLISWLQSPSVVILEPRKIKSDTVSTVFPSISHEVVGPDAMIFIF